MDGCKASSTGRFLDLFSAIVVQLTNAGRFGSAPVAVSLTVHDVVRLAAPIALQAETREALELRDGPEIGRKDPAQFAIRRFSWVRTDHTCKVQRDATYRAQSCDGGGGDGGVVVVVVVVEHTNQN